MSSSGGNSRDPNSRSAASGSAAASPCSGTLEERSYSFGHGMSEFAFAGGGGGGSGGTAVSSSLIRHSSSPAGLLNRLASDSGFETYSTSGSHKLSRLSSQLSFNKTDSLSQYSEVDHGVVDGTSSRRDSQSSAMVGFALGQWDNSNPIMFNASSNKQAKHFNSDDVRSGLSQVESQYNLLHTALDMTNMERLINIPEDSVPCKIRAKRGFATHPRSIAERERRTRISEKLKKLQELVPQMDKQTSYSDMLDLAVQYIKGLQSQIQQINKELEHCKCGCKPKAQI